MKEIQLTKGFVTLVDDDDYEWLNRWKWHYSHGYAMRRISKHGKFIHMSRLILGIKSSKIFADHIDRNGLNNQRSNLRVATRSQNNANRTIIGSSGFLGVFRTSAKKESWFARVNKNGKRYYLGSFDNKIDAAKAFNEAAIKIHGEFANLNQV
jgi:hypothetical protein